METPTLPNCPVWGAKSHDGGGTLGPLFLPMEGMRLGPYSFACAACYKAKNKPHGAELKWPPSPNITNANC
jgi:hypothetical protein